MESNLGSSPEGRLELYTTAFRLFEEGYSHPQIIEALSDFETNISVLTKIVDKAMQEEWDKIYNDAIKLFALKRRRDEVITELLKKEPDNGVVEILVDDLYNRRVDLISDLNERSRRRRKRLRFIGYLAIGSLLIFLITGKGYSGFTLIFVFASWILLFLFYEFWSPVKKLKSFRRHVIFERLKKRKLVTRIKKLFLTKKENVLNVYCTAGYPQLDSTVEVMKCLQSNGVDLIELGMPYSDPLADGPVIQASSTKALQNGMTISKLFEQLKDFRVEVQVPVILMGYLNPLLQYGFESFCSKAAEVGIDGLIIPDIPMYEYENEYREIVQKHNLDFIFLVTPETSEERIRKLDELSSGFLYAVSSSSITGSDKDFSAVENYLERLSEMKLKNPILVGFGIKDRLTFEAACKYANGAIIGSAYIKAIENGNTEEATKKFLEGVLE